MKIKRIHLFPLCLAFLLASCGEAPNLPKVDHIEVESSILRFDKALSQLDTTDLPKSYQALKLKYPALSELMFSKIIPVISEDKLDYDKLKDFLSNQYTRQALDTIQVLLADLSMEEKELNQALKYYKHYFPEAVIPKVYGGYSDYTFQTFIFDDYQADGICASLDLFLGEDYPYKDIDPTNVAFSEYISKRYDRKFMVKKIMELLTEEQVGALQGKRFVDHMIYQGKKWYLLKQLLPEHPMNIISEFTEEQYNWCLQNEKSIWSLFLDQELMYETNQQKIKTYVFESPRSAGMPEEAPGRTAHYLGFKVVEKYMDETKSSISELIKEKDSQKILKLSKYKPKRK